MISSTDATEIQLEANPGFERRWNHVQTALQCLIALFVSAGLVGLFGQGWLARATKAFDRAPLQVHYERLLRANAPTEVRVTVASPLPSETLQIGVGSELLEHASINSTQPRAASIDATASGVTYSFRLGPDRQGAITFKLAPRRIGWIVAQLSSQGEQLDLPLLIYP
ncbi:hypothetical protein [Methylobacterium oxalidis]|uniref:Uncharacterized protein n=1 Tax=Methylobacterium oxalidis TaxID=944322 RepID=A0A512JCY6_9HYPH|nr:hypothetical protein [Methylobacterium oxalidis]GEP07832.1 hypothetical protein MOX02_58700 [Methylobacterium oxalidis]GJE35285.1 hypothetical protein LDDCCGHA_5503 [Methylobacterium oxalidis]GLS64872.1 hypothetical protein GCM10007888_32530 [Methylobacterium oxalidis]